MRTLRLAFVMVSVVGLSRAQNITSGLVAHYTFESGPNDVSGSGNNAMPAGLYQYISGGLVGVGIRLSGDNSLFYAGGGHVLLPNFSASMNSGFTVSLWARDEALGGDPVNGENYITFGILDQPSFGISLNSVTRELAYYLQNGLGALNKDIAKILNFPADLRVWKHLVLTYTPGKMAAYYNGAKIGEALITANVFPVTRAALGRHWWSGGAGSSARMSVTLDNVRIYSRALSDADIQQLYATDPLPLIPAPTITTQPIAQTVIEQQGTTFRVAAASTTPLLYQWRKNDVPIPNAVDSSYTIPAVRTSDAGTYSVTVSNAAATVVSSAAVLTVKSADPGRLGNVSIRAIAGPGDATLISGLNVKGQTPVTVLVRAVGPTLALFSVPGVLANPRITLYRDSTIIAVNDDWSDVGAGAIASAAIATGAFALPANSLDSAILVTLQPGSYTVHVTGAGSSTGVALVEAYEVP